MRIALVGHVSIDKNVVGGVERELCGGAVVHGGITAARVGAETFVYTLCAPDDRERFGFLSEAGIDVVFLPSDGTTSIRNVYPSDNPDERQSSVITRARPFTHDDIERIAPCDVVHVNALWAGEIDPALIALARSRGNVVAGDAQGFVRHVLEDGSMVHRDWEAKRTFLPAFDVFKVDIKEAQILTGQDDRHDASRALHEMGVGVVVLTHREGVCVFDGEAFHERPFGPYPLEGRTGRGDTCMASFLVFSVDGDLERATARAAEVTSKKLQYHEPYRG